MAADLYGGRELKVSMKLLEVKALGGINYVRADKVIALQTTPTGNTIILMEGGATLQSSETPAAIAKLLMSLEPAN